MKLKFIIAIFLLYASELNAQTTKVFPHSAVLVRVPENSYGSGVISEIKNKKYILTAYHVTKGASKVTIISTATGLRGIGVEVDDFYSIYDIAVYLLPKNMSHLPSVKMTERHISTDESVAVFSFPHQTPTVSVGKFLRYKYTNISKVPYEIIFTAPVDSGSSGGMIVDSRGKLLGLAVGYRTDKYSTKSIGVTSAVLMSILKETYSFN